MKIFLPFYYLFYSRLRSNISKVAWIFTYIIPIFIVSYYGLYILYVLLLNSPQKVDSIQVTT